MSYCHQNNASIWRANPGISYKLRYKTTCRIKFEYCYQGKESFLQTESNKKPLFVFYISFQEYVSQGISHPVFYGDRVYKLRRVKCDSDLYATTVDCCCQKVAIVWFWFFIVFKGLRILFTSFCYIYFIIFSHPSLLSRKEHELVSLVSRFWM